MFTRNHIVCPSFQSGGTQILKISKRGRDLKKEFRVGETKRGKRFSKWKGNSTFQVECRDKEGQKWAASNATALDIYSVYAYMAMKSVFTVISIWGTIIFKIWGGRVFRNFRLKRGEPIFQVRGGGKKGENQNFSKILGEPKPYKLWSIDYLISNLICLAKLSVPIRNKIM